ncbi:MAG: DUF2062 domain-containing protein [Methylococcaceae bacterium]|nr:MAG: DUF2062 domain-containing protein [Methylococcaceae bacterium]
MPKKLIQRYLPDPHKIRDIKSLQFLGDALHRPNLWHLNRRSVAKAFACGLFAMYTPPLPWQMIIAGILAVYFDAYLPIAVALVWITNPVTWLPMYYFAYWVGTLLTGRDAFAFSAFSQVFSLETVWSLGAPFLLGCLILMIGGAVLGYFGVNAYWRWHVRRAWDERKLRRQGIVVERKAAWQPLLDLAWTLARWCFTQVEPYLQDLGSRLAGMILQAWFSPKAEQWREKLSVHNERFRAQLIEKLKLWFGSAEES